MTVIKRRLLVQILPWADQKLSTLNSIILQLSADC